MFICTQQRASPHVCMCLGGMSCRSVTQSEVGVSRNVWLLWRPADQHVNREVSYGERETRGGVGGCRSRNEERHSGRIGAKVQLRAQQYDGRKDTRSKYNHKKIVL